MKINRKNYEAFFLDYKENSLSPEQVTELFIFLAQNPDLKEEFETFENIELIADGNIRFGQKEALKRNELIPTDNINVENYNEFIVADLEGDLGEDESIELKAFISLNPKTKLEYNIFRSTFLKPESSIHFKGKEKLKKTNFLLIYRKQAIYAFLLAASIIILLGVYFGFIYEPAKKDFTYSIQKLSPKSGTTGTSVQIEGNKTVFPLQIEPRSNKTRVQHNINPADSGSRPGMQFFAHLEFRKPLAVVANNSEIKHLDLALRNSGMTGTSIALSEHGNESNNQRSFASRFISGLVGKVIKTDNFKRKSFLDYTIDGYNLMADKGVVLEKEVDKNGKVIAYSLNGESISFSRNRNPGKE